MVLEEVFKKLNKEGIEVILDDSQPRGVYCRYGTNVCKIISRFNEIDVTCVPEMLEIGVPDECIVIENFNDKMQISYEGSSPISMLETLKRLRLPSWCSDNLGESALIDFKLHLDDYIKNGKDLRPISITATYRIGKEKHLVYMLNKVLENYRKIYSMQPQS